MDIVASRRGRRLNICLILDRKTGGITLNECADINREISAILDKENFIQESYILEVSSPGVDRPLVTEDDFRRNISRNLRLTLRQEEGGDLQVEGELLKVGSGGIVVKTKEGEVDIPLTKIKKAKQIILR